MICNGYINDNVGKGRIGAFGITFERNNIERWVFTVRKKIEDAPDRI
jgi:hypothetical protein